MSQVTELIDLIVQGKNAEASDVLNTELLTRSVSAINELKPHVAADYFKHVADSVLETEVEEAPEQTEEESTNEAD